MELFRITNRAGIKHPTLWDAYENLDHAKYVCPWGWWIESYHTDKPDVHDIGFVDCDGKWHGAES